MMDRKIMRSLLENMEHAAEETLRRDTAFHKSLQALKYEIDSDPRVQATVCELQARGRGVFKSFVPHIKVRVRTEQGVFALPKPAQIAGYDSAEPVGRLTDELKIAASSVIKNSRHYRELDSIINRAVGTDDRFEGIASEFEKAGYEVLICLDLSTYAQIQNVSVPASQPARERQPVRRADPRQREPRPARFSGSDRQFLKALKITIEDN